MKLTKEQIDNFNKNQLNSNYHPLTCDRESKNCEVTFPRDPTKDGVLIATENGLTCPCGDYKQKIL